MNTLEADKINECQPVQSIFDSLVAEMNEKIIGTINQTDYSDLDDLEISFCNQFRGNLDIIYSKTYVSNDYRSNALPGFQKGVYLFINSNIAHIQRELNSTNIDRKKYVSYLESLSTSFEAVQSLFVISEDDSFSETNDLSDIPSNQAGEAQNLETQELVEAL